SPRRRRATASPQSAFSHFHLSLGAPDAGPFYSARKATAGSTLVARRAGNQLAARPAANRIAPTPAKLVASPGCTPKRSVVIDRVAASAPATPSARPVATSTNP